VSRPIGSGAGEAVLVRLAAIEARRGAAVQESTSWIAAVAGVSRRTVQRRLKAARAAGEIQVQRHTRRRRGLWRNSYHVLALPLRPPRACSSRGVSNRGSCRSGSLSRFARWGEQRSTAGAVPLERAAGGYPRSGTLPAADHPQRHDVFGQVRQLLKVHDPAQLRVLVQLSGQLRTYGGEADVVRFVAKADQLTRKHQLRSPWHVWYRWAVDQLADFVPRAAQPGYMRRHARPRGHEQRWHEASPADVERYELGQFPSAEPLAPDRTTSHQSAPAPARVLEATLRALDPLETQFVERLAARDPAAARAWLAGRAGAAAPVAPPPLGGGS